VIGASADPRKTAGKPIAYLRKHGFRGQILPVNPKVENIDDLRCYPSIEALPIAPDVAMVMLGASRVPDALEALAAKGVGHAIVVASGFGETGDAGKARQDQIDTSRGTMRVLGPNTIGLVNVTDAISLCASGALEIDNLRAGPIALVSQSGGILGSVLSRGVAQGLGFSKLISTSNEADITVSDCIDALVDDPATQVIALYLESIRDARAFRAACQKAHAAASHHNRLLFLFRYCYNPVFLTAGWSL
jgi:acyl-CoA synthetase (NDP forming)